MRLGRLLHLLQDEGGNLRGRILLAVRGDPGVAVGRLDDLVGDEAHVLLGHRVVEGAADQALDREEGALGIGDGLALGRLADEALAVVGEGDDRRRGARALGILDDLGRRAFHDRDAGIGRAQVDADDFSHCLIPSLFRETARPRSGPAADSATRPPLSRRPARSGPRCPVSNCRRRDAFGPKLRRWRVYKWGPRTAQGVGPPPQKPEISTPLRFAQAAGAARRFPSEAADSNSPPMMRFPIAALALALASELRLAHAQLDLPGAPTASLARRPPTTRANPSGVPKSGERRARRDKAEKIRRSPASPPRSPAAAPQRARRRADCCGGATRRSRSPS